ncbi:MAG TPA: diphthine--ammonia ligase [Methanocorpusculum sp.]|nr:diphthine--ammonia ligase [Methanocorpusculum sp.]
MKLASLTSGGKDSILAIQKALEAGHTVPVMITAVPENTESYMFHSANLAAVPVMAQRAGMQYVPVFTKGEKEAELDDLMTGIRNVRDTYGIEGVVTGAIASEYQRSRIAAVCSALNLTLYAPLWGMSPDDVIRDVSQLLDARIVVTAADGLGENVLGKRIDENLIPVLKDVEKKRRINIAGEGGEYESLVFNAPFFSSPVQADGMKTESTGMTGKVTYERFR